MQYRDYNYLLRKAETISYDYSIDLRFDPDTDGCEELYDDIREAFFNDFKLHVENLKQYNNKYEFYTIRIDKKYLFSSDYMGPSVFWARECGIKDRKIIDFLNVCRKLGGHIVWPRGGHRPKGVYTVNVAKSGCYGLYDRMDWTLYLLKIFYDSKGNQETFLEVANQLLPEEFRRKNNFNDKFLLLYRSFDFYKEEFELFHTFRGFCDRFKLVNSFVDDQYRVIPMIDLFPILPRDYNDYITNVCTAVKKRNNILHA